MYNVSQLALFLAPPPPCVTVFHTARDKNVGGEWGQVYTWVTYCQTSVLSEFLESFEESKATEHVSVHVQLKSSLISSHFILILCQLIQIVSYRDLAEAVSGGYNPYGLVMVVWVEHMHVYWKCPDLTHYIFTLLVWKFLTIDKEGQLMNISVWEWGWSCGIWFCTCKCNSFAVCYSVTLLLCVTVCMCAGEDSEPWGECGDNSGTYQPSNKWTKYFVSWLLNFN